VRGLPRRFRTIPPVKRARGLLAFSLLAAAPAARAGTPTGDAAAAVAVLAAEVDALEASYADLPDPDAAQRKAARALAKADAALAKPAAGSAARARAAKKVLGLLRVPFPPGAAPSLDAARDPLVPAFDAAAGAAAACGAEEAVVLRRTGPSKKVAGLAAKAEAARGPAAAKAADGRPDKALALLAGGLGAAEKALALASKERARQGGAVAERVRSALAASCASCHSGEDPAGGLDLAGPYAWGDLRLGRAAHAEAAGTPFVGADAASSFLWTKVGAGTGPGSDPDHAGHLDADAKADLAAWLDAGAPAASPSQVVLRPPASGFQARMPPFLVPEGGEGQREFHFLAPAGAAMRIVRVEALGPPGMRWAHLFEAWQSVPGGDIRDREAGTVVSTFAPMDFDTWSLRATAPETSFAWDLPAGYGLPVAAGARLLLQVHADDLGDGGAPAGGGAVVNFHTVAVAEAPTRVGTMFGRNRDLLLLPGSNDDWDMGATMFFLFHPGATEVLGATGILRPRGTALEIRAWDGAGAQVNGAPGPGAFDDMGEGNRLHRSTDWQRPGFTTHAPGSRPLPQGWGALYRASTSNPGDDFLPFGPHAVDEEMADMILFFAPGPADGRTLAFPLPSQ
jgi:hypothetical protein